jgi:hypothetical protein
MPNDADDSKNDEKVNGPARDMKDDEPKNPGYGQENADNE